MEVSWRRGMDPCGILAILAWCKHGSRVMANIRNTLSVVSGIQELSIPVPSPGWRLRPLTLTRESDTLAFLLQPGEVPQFTRLRTSIKPVIILPLQYNVCAYE